MARAVLAAVASIHYIEMDTFGKKSERGVALIMVMVAVFALSVMVGAFAYSMKVETRLAQTANNGETLIWIGRARPWIRCRFFGTARWDRAGAGCWDWLLAKGTRWVTFPVLRISTGNGLL